MRIITAILLVTTAAYPTRNEVEILTTDMIIDIIKKIDAIRIMNAYSSSSSSDSDYDYELFIGNFEPIKFE